MKVPLGKIPDVIILIELLVIWLVGMLTVEYLYKYAQLNFTDVCLIAIYHVLLLGLLFKFIIEPFREKWHSRNGNIYDKR